MFEPQFIIWTKIVYLHMEGKSDIKDTWTRKKNKSCMLSMTQKYYIYTWRERVILKTRGLVRKIKAVCCQ
jgi:hypothetical protein